MKKGNLIDWSEKVIKYLDVINSYTRVEKLETTILHKNENMELKEMKLLQIKYNYIKKQELLEG